MAPRRSGACPPGKASRVSRAQSSIARDDLGFAERRIIEREDGRRRSPSGSSVIAGSRRQPGLDRHSRGGSALRPIQRQGRACLALRHRIRGTALHAPLVFAEIYPSLRKPQPVAGEVHDAAQVRTLAEFFAKKTRAARSRELVPRRPRALRRRPRASRARRRVDSRSTEERNDLSPRPPGDLSRLLRAHPARGRFVARAAGAARPGAAPCACGGRSDVGDRELLWSPDAVERGARRLRAGAADPGRCARWSRRASCRASSARRQPRASATIADTRVPASRAALGTTRSAAAVELWRPHLAGAVVAIGNAPTALFHLLEADRRRRAQARRWCWDFPVGFVGAAEAKAALAENRVRAFLMSRCPGGAAAARWPRRRSTRWRCGDEAMSAWLAVVGLGEDGLGRPRARRARARRRAPRRWSAARAISHWCPRAGPSASSGGARSRPASPTSRRARGRRVVVLASGDPMCYGVGAMLARALRARGDDRAAGSRAPSRSRRRASSGRSRIASRCRCMAARSTSCAFIWRPARASSRSAPTATRPRARPRFCARRAGVRRRSPCSSIWAARASADSTAPPRIGARRASPISISSPSNAGRARARAPARASPGLPDDAFEHDGQLTKREVRAATLGGAGAAAGRVAVGYRRGLRLDRDRMAARGARDARHCDRARSGARWRSSRATRPRLGVPELEIVQGAAPAALADLPRARCGVHRRRR